MSATTDRLGRSRRYYGRKGVRHWTAERITEKAKEWSERFNEPPRGSDWDPTRMKMLAQTAREKATAWEMRISIFTVGDYPSRRTVNEIFGSWNAMIEAAKLPPRAPSQRTARGVNPSPLLLPFGHVVNRVYEAEDLDDREGLISALKEVEKVARMLRRKIEAT